MSGLALASPIYQLRVHITLPSSSSSSSSHIFRGFVCRSQLGRANNLKFVLHEALDSSGINTAHARDAREGFCSQIKRLSNIERETSISINRGVDLGRTALYIAAEDDSLISHSSVPLPVDAFLERLDDHSMRFCTQYSSSFRSSPENIIKCLERYLYVDKGFRRTNARNQSEQRALYLPSVLTHRLGSATMLSLIYSEILKMLRLWGLLDFDIEIFFPHNPISLPRGYRKQKSKESDQPHIMTSESLLTEILRDLKNAFWPFQLDNNRSLFLRAAHAANYSDGSNNVEESAFNLASAKAARHRLERGVWTSVRFGDMRRALSACERLILLETDPKELRDYSVLLYHCGFYEESLQFLRYYQDAKKESSDSFIDVEEDAVEKLIIRLNLILMKEGWSRPSHGKSFLSNNSEPW
ncbi:Alpha-1,3-mannosyltransferase [Actinidia chinensis var. chinensis]|uniref:Alpha-1,3-mannosyltransferase n=1 Tax=Actinidia chinensis var. chinensis TaxID=1590841 RepID=A0A2R6R354_ACTCC|nr:Alpha-1,3-mannosyltransferase [Actinidia chinensis var. chinensis]